MEKINNLNSLIIEGKIKDFAFSEKLNGFYVACITIGVVRYCNGEEELSVFDCQAYGRMAELLNRKNGSENRLIDADCRIVGRLKSEQYKDEDGKTLSRIYIVCEHVETQE